MNLKLNRPLAFFDLETTGVNVSVDRIVEISILKVSPDGREAVKTLRINPGIPIPVESSLFHGIYDEDIKEAPVFKDVARELADFIGNADLAGYNSNKFDIPMLMEEFIRAGVDFSLDGRHFVDVQNIFHQMEQRTLKAAYRFYCDSNLDNAHSAESDVRATYEVLKSQLDRYQGTEWEDKLGNRSVPVVNDVEALHRFTNLSRPVDFAGRMVFNEQGDEVFNFGKHKGRSVEEVFTIEPSYYSWMMQGDFPLYTKKCLDKIWQRFRAKQKEQRVIANKSDTAVKSAPMVASPNQEKRDYKQQHQRPKPKTGPITADMLKSLQEKFGK
ncbi:3'-5' exonuclease [Parapedobacter koreensis]|uniref:DNA polymerase-3 subunit epsilon n=1 Tax=Parapedobacter koreensis TaxID=332977 RepID=A0A1H7MQ56_9SPHI|nr:3'-5' exonuclease [Parapedobacter koreensis]SEL12815.1 DNA polymerase-3 subunit epsilon [Parapedobacter koreensis]